MTLPRPFLLAALGLGLAACCAAQEHPPLRLVQTIPLPEVAGRIDHFAVDVRGQRLFLAALEKNTVEVVDLPSGKVAETLTGFAKPQGVLFVGALNRLFVASGKDGAVKTFDGRSLLLTHTATVSLGADALGYDPVAREIYVGSGGGDAKKELGDLTVFDATSGRQVAAVATDAHAGG